MTARIYTYENGNLPNLTGANVGDLIIALKSALITGYAGTPGAGWKLVYESAPNSSDTTYRIVVQSQAPDSEQRYFEIEDVSSVKGTIKVWSNWITSTQAGQNLLMQSLINKSQWGLGFEIAADDKFVHYTVNSGYHAFGDADVFDTAQDKTIVFNMQSTTASDGAAAIASTNNPNRTRFIDAHGNEYVCRSFCREVFGYSAAISRPQTEQYNGGDRADFVSGILTHVRKTELLKIVGGYYESYAFLPMFVYTDNPRTMTGQIVPIDGVAKKIGFLGNRASYHLNFAVDV